MSEEHISDIMPEVLERYQIRVLPTTYHGIRFRSRVEARWAVFFDSLRLKYEYEPEGFDLGNGVCYLPDFWLPGLGVWVEIKGQDPDQNEAEKAHRLAVATKKRVYVFYHGHTLPDGPHGPPQAYAFFPDGTADWGYSWCECPTCGGLGIEYGGRTDRLPCKEPHESWLARKSGGNGQPQGCPRIGSNGDKGQNTATPKLIAAYHAARAMRFGR